MKALIVIVLLAAAVTAAACPEDEPRYDVLCASKCVDAGFGFEYCKKVCAL